MNDEEISIKFIEKHFDDEDYYRQVLSTLNIEYGFFCANVSIFNIRHLINHCKLNDQIVQHIIQHDLEELDFVMTKQTLNDKTIEQILTKGSPLHSDDRVHNVQVMQRIPCKFIQKYKDILSMHLISANQYLDLRFLIDNREELDWPEIMLNCYMEPVINEGFITLFHETNLWDNVPYVSIPVATLAKYIEYFTETTYANFYEHMELTKDDLLKLSLEVSDKQVMEMPETKE